MVFATAGCVTAVGAEGSFGIAARTAALGAFITEDADGKAICNGPIQRVVHNGDGTRSSGVNLHVHTVASGTAVRDMLRCRSTVRTLTWFDDKCDDIARVALLQILLGSRTVQGNVEIFSSTVTLAASKGRVKSL